MSDTNKQSPADQVAADLQEAVEAMLEASSITMTRGNMTRKARREFLIQEASLRAQLLESEGHGELAARLLGVAADLRLIQPKVEATGKGLVPEP